MTDLAMAFRQHQLALEYRLQEPCQALVPHWWHLSGITPFAHHDVALQGQVHAGG